MIQTKGYSVLKQIDAFPMDVCKDSYELLRMLRETMIYLSEKTVVPSGEVAVRYDATTSTGRLLRIKLEGVSKEMLEEVIAPHLTALSAKYTREWLVSDHNVIGNKSLVMCTTPLTPKETEFLQIFDINGGSQMTFEGLENNMRSVRKYVFGWPDLWRMCNDKHKAIMSIWTV